MTEDLLSTQSLSSDASQCEHWVGTGRGAQGAPLAGEAGMGSLEEPGPSMSLRLRGPGGWETGLREELECSVLGIKGG